MSWPTDADYVEAFQNVVTAFGDPALRSGVVETDAMGMPKPRSGNFAIVFKVRVGPTDWAVRCFKRDVSDRAQRYRAVDSHLRTVSVPSLTHFAFVEQGVRIRGQWFAVLKMEWVAGELLGTWIERHLRSHKCCVIWPTNGYK